MKKTFIQISRFKSAAVSMVILSGITFTLFSFDSVDITHGEIAKYCVAEQVATINVEPSITQDGAILLASNIETSTELLEQAWLNFCRKNVDGTKLNQIFHFVVDELGDDINISQATINGDVAEGYLNIALRLYDGAVVSINKYLDSLENGMVAFNIFRNRNLLISDEVKMKDLSLFLQRVQARIS